MIKYFLILSLAIVVWGCKKNNTSENTNTSSSKRLQSVSIRNLTTRTRLTDSFLFDNNNRMAECRTMTYDTFTNSGGFITGISYHQNNFIFNYAGTDTLPSSYLMTFSYSSDSYQHLLTYNNTRQLVKDSDLNHVNNVYLSYPPNTIVTKGPIIAGYTQTRTDSIILQIGNIASRHYIFPADPSSNSFDQIVYSGLQNPLYNFKGMGILLDVILDPDFDWISRNLYTMLSNSRGKSISMNWSTDNDGNAIAGSGFTSAGIIIEVIFTYK